MSLLQRSLAVVGILTTALAGCAVTPGAPASEAGVASVEAPLVIVPASRDTSVADGVVSWRLYGYSKGDTVGLTAVGLDALGQVRRATRIFDVPGATGKATIAIAALWPHAGRARVTEDGRVPEQSLTASALARNVSSLGVDMDLYVRSGLVDHEGPACARIASVAITCLGALAAEDTPVAVRACGSGLRDIVTAESCVQKVPTAAFHSGALHITTETFGTPGDFGVPFRPQVVDYTADGYGVGVANVSELSFIDAPRVAPTGEPKTAASDTHDFADSAERAFCTDCADASTSQTIAATLTSSKTDSPKQVQFSVSVKTPIPGLGDKFSVSVDTHHGKVWVAPGTGIGKPGAMTTETSNWVLSGTVDTRPFMQGLGTSLAEGVGMAAQVSVSGTPESGGVALGIGDAAGAGIKVFYGVQGKPCTACAPGAMFCALVSGC